MEPVKMFERAATVAAELARSVRPDQTGLATPCSEWDVAALLDHMAGGMTYMQGALGVQADGVEKWPEQAAIDAIVVIACRLFILCLLRVGAAVRRRSGRVGRAGVERTVGRMCPAGPTQE